MSAPAVAVSAKHNIFAVAWKDMRKGEPNIYWSIAAEPNFKSEQLVHSSTDGEQDHPSLAIDHKGRVWIAWEDTRHGQREVRIRSNQKTDQEFRLNDPKFGPASYPVLASGSGLLAVVFESGKGPQKQIQFQVVER